MKYLICPFNDNFTCITIRGKSIVDYFVIAQENVDDITNFKVTPVSAMLEKLNLHQGTTGRISEHSILMCGIFMRPTQSLNSPPSGSTIEAISHRTDTTVETVNSNVTVMPPRYKIKSVPNDFLSDSDNTRHCIELIDEIIETP